MAALVHDGRNRRKTVTDRLAGFTTLNWHPIGHLASIVDVEGQTTSCTHNTRGQKIVEAHPDHVPGSAAGTAGCGIFGCVWDAGGRKLRRSDQTGATVTMNYDLACRVAQCDCRTAANAPSGTIAVGDVFQFDSASRMALAISGRCANRVG